jgi:hypothetical protein
METLATEKMLAALAGVSRVPLMTRASGEAQGCLEMRDSPRSVEFIGESLAEAGRRELYLVEVDDAEISRWFSTRVTYCAIVSRVSSYPPRSCLPKPGPRGTTTFERASSGRSDSGTVPLS